MGSPCSRAECCLGRLVSSQAVRICASLRVSPGPVRDGRDYGVRSGLLPILDTAPAVPSRRPGVARSARSRGATLDDRGAVRCHACPRERADSPSGGRRDGTPGRRHLPPASLHSTRPSRRPACPARALLRSWCPPGWSPLAVVSAGRRDRAPARMPALPGSGRNGPASGAREGAALKQYGKSNHALRSRHRPGDRRPLRHQGHHDRLRARATSTSTPRR